MNSVSQSIFYVLTFLSVYVQIFFLVTFFERRKDILVRKDKIKLKRYPSVTIIVPCYNEEKTIYKTMRSLLALDYPKNRLKFIVVDDGSKDRTWEIIQRFKKYSQVEVYTKENGGKHTAMNFALTKAHTDLVGGLDADSFVHPEALKRIVTYFEDKTVMAVAPSIIVEKPKTIVQKAQKAEYDMAIYTKKMLAFLGGIHVTPGPFSIFRKKVFDDLGPYKKAHNTEDQEIALRMQEHGYRIEHCPDAYVYTVGPNTIKKLYRQRIRWIYGFLRNAMDYKRMFFKNKYGTVGMFTIPSGVISIVSVIFLSSLLVYNVANYLTKKIVQFKTVGISPSVGFQFDWFFINTQALVFISIVLYGLVILTLLMGRRMAEGRIRLSWDILYFFVVFSVVAPLWILKAVWNVIRSKETSWTLERQVKPNQS